MITHWDELEGVRRERGHIAATWTSLSGDSSIGVGVRRVAVDPGMWSTPYHLENSEEEIFYVLAGSGVSLQGEDLGEPTAHEVGPGDCLVHLASVHAHTLRAGSDGLDVLAFGERHYPVGSTYLPRVGVSWGLGAWARTGAPEDHPWRREAEAGPPELPPPGLRPPRIVNVAGVEPDLREGATVCRLRWDLGRAAGSVRTGLKIYEAPPGKLSVPPHCHSAEEEIFVVLEGEGTLELWHDGGRIEEVLVRAGHTVSRPPGTGVAHTFRGGAGPLRFLAYGTRVAGDVAWYPRSGKVFLRGVGVVLRPERLDYWDGED